MNRQQRRSLEHRLHSTKGAEVIKKMFTDASYRTENPLEDGDPVKLNIERIKSRAEWKSLQPAYRDFVEQNADTVFTAKIHHRSESGYPITVDLEECGDWSFWEGDLTRVSCETCAHIGLETMDDVGHCNICENFDQYREAAP